jgi:hypothetical protein
MILITVTFDRQAATAITLDHQQQLLERLQENPGPNEREEIERLLAQIDTALDLLEEAGPSEPE